MSDDAGGGVLLYWLPLGAGGHVVRWNGRFYEALAARRERRTAADLYHSALVVDLDGSRHTVEMAPAWGVPARERGVAVQGPVGLRVLGRSVLFRYEVRCWRDGVIPDLGYAVDSPRVLTRDVSRCARLLALVSAVPRLTWGRDELGAGEMWNCNSVVAWLLARTERGLADVPPPPRGRAPGWSAGVRVATGLS